MNKWANYGKWRHPELYKKYSKKMKQSKNIISDWLEKHGDPEIAKLVEQQVREIMAETNIEYQYLDLLQDILENGVEKKDRTGTGTISVFGRQIRHKMSEGFPLLTTKKMAFKTMVTELLWFLRGSTRGDELVRENCYIWVGDMYSNYIKITKREIELNKSMGFHPDYNLPKEKFIHKIKTDDKFAKRWGELGPIYGKQWRSWSQGVLEDKYLEKIDQIQNLINNLKTNPDSRRMIVSAWNPADLPITDYRTDDELYNDYLKDIE